MSSVYGINEEKLRTTFRNCKSLRYKNSEYKILKVGKPRPTRGECKTDVYILGESSQGTQEFKLSVKQRNTDFLENKISLDRAIEIFGPNAKNIISTSTKNLQKNFLDENLVFFEQKNKTEAKSITLGWKFELFNKPSGDKSGLVLLDNHQKTEVYSGINASIEKRYCRVNDEFVENSGVANFILEIDLAVTDDANYHFQRIKPVQDMSRIKQYTLRVKP